VQGSVADGDVLLRQPARGREFCVWAAVLMHSALQHQIRLAEAQSSALNKAYETLRSPLLRAHWLLEDLGADVPAEDEGVDDAELLMEVMELREALDEASSSEAVDEVREQNEAHIERTIQQLGEAFAAEPADIQAAREGSVRLRYWLNIEKAAKERLD